MDTKPLSARLLNEQGIVTFLLLEIAPSLDGYAVRVQEKDQQFTGLVVLAQGAKEFKEYKEAIDDYADYLKEKEAYEKASDNMKASKGKPKEVPQPTVQITRVTHEQFPQMK